MTTSPPALDAPGTAAGAPVPAAPGARQVWRRLRGRPSALVAGGVLALLIVLALAAPLLAAIAGQDPNTYHDSLIDSARGGVPLGSFGGVSGDHWLGVEPGTGRDLFVRMLYGARISLLVAVGATVVQVIIGVAIGLAAGLGNRLLDSFLSRVTDLMVALPMLVLAIALTAVVSDSFPRPLLLILVIGLLNWGGTARIVRAQTLTLKSLDFVAAARLGGSGQAAGRAARAAAVAGGARHHVRGDPRPHEHRERGVAVVPRHRRQAADAVLGADAVERADLVPGRSDVRPAARRSAVRDGVRVHRAG